MGKLRVEKLVSRHAAVGTSRHTLAGRAFLSVTWEHEGATHFGEASPLSGYGADDLERAQAELEAFTALELATLSEAVGAAWDPHAAGFLVGEGSPVGVLFSQTRSLKSPAARFCIEMLVLGAAAGSRGVPLWRLLAGERVADRLPTSAVIDPCAPGWRDRFDAPFSCGVRAFKLKCGRDSAREVEVARTIVAQEGVRIRLDPNGAWSPDEATQVLSQMPHFPIDWIEDPTASPAQWPALRAAHPAPLALDEPLAQGLSSAEVRALSPDFLILKPMAIGGFGACLEWALLAREIGARVIVSHLFDGRAAFAAATELAFVVQSPEFAPGLGEHPALAADPGPAPAPAALQGEFLVCP